MGFPSEDEMRAEFRKLREEIKALEISIAPFRDQYDKITQDFHKKIKPLTAKIKDMEKPLFDLKNRMGTIVRALGGKTGG